MANARRAVPSLSFNGKNASTQLANYLQSVAYTDVASGGSDQLNITLQNIDGRWLDKWYPTKGDKIKGSIQFQNWEASDKTLSLSCGTFILDEIRFSGGPMTASFGSLSVPSNASFRTRERTKTWKNVTIKQIQTEIGKRYSLKALYSGPSYTIKELEQSQQNDSEFLYSLCKDYGLCLKVYNTTLVIFDPIAMEKKKAVATLTRKSFVNDEWEYTDALLGTYTGARISYKNPNKDSSNTNEKDISIYVGLIAENASGSRVLRINGTCDSQTDAYVKAAAQVNEANRQATTFSATIWANPKISAGVCVKISGMGKANGKYYVDQVETEVGSSGSTMKIEAHKVQKTLSTTPQAPAASKKQESKSYKVGDVGNFHGGTHYVSSWPGAKGYSARAGKAKITLGPDCAGNGKAHPWHLIHTDSNSNVYGWVDEGTFD